jgi:mono/diheme cytochrome c family protein
LKHNVWLAIVLIIFLAAGCSRHADAAIPKTTATNTQQHVTPTPLANTTFGVLADAGAEAYRVYCSGCHGGFSGVNGLGGVALIGPGSSLFMYGTVNGLLIFITHGRPFAMPYENPGSLTATQYDEITAYLSVQNAFVSPITSWENLSDIILQ